ncbi:DNA cytosine methyltransferase [Pedosphaera parvula]|uniref:DNA (cytosine-5-)-methyltransferase n=1 Tax=Pedosphaera parvula (strain Ellin514) TaxID=320771 RepID=B9XI05_PEDPL|nr:DNA cytosine methyltransferase [Pedosphaera parvula]EEF60498.1 DNA-cytosine methyltransferase [Pedosphaera parvula Ellin514]
MSDSIQILRSLELFAGAGGLAIGLHHAGFKPRALVEFNRHACETLRFNADNGFETLNGAKLFAGDVREVDFAEIDAVDVVTGGPPCQPFSIGGKHKGRQDERDMFPQAVRAVRTLKPKAFIFENVKGLLRESFTEYFEFVVLQLSYPTILRRVGEDWRDHLSRLERHHTKAGEAGELAYRVVFRLLNAADYGVPQFRERVFIVGFRHDLGIEWSFPKPTHSYDALVKAKWVTGDYWEQHKIAKKHRPKIPDTLKKQVQFLSSEFDMFNMHERMRTVRDALVGLPEPQLKPEGYGVGLTNHELRLKARSYPGHTGSPIDEPSKALKAGGHGVPGGENMILFNDGTVRYFTTREAARIQRFPDNYHICGSWTEGMRQVGNAVPVELAHVVGASVRKQLLKNGRSQQKGAF